MRLTKHTKSLVRLTWKLSSQAQHLSPGNLEAKLPRGFTLIETLVYLALYAIIISGALTAAYGMFESGARNETAAMVEEEGDYLTAKIDWSLSDAASVQSPAISGDLLSVTRFDGSTVNIRSLGSVMRIQENDEPAQTLNNSNVSIADLSFTHALSTSDGLDPESISASFIVYATTTDGHVLSRDFSSLEYLRK